MNDLKGPDLSLPTVAAYSSANFGINMVNAFSNFALPLYLAGYGLPSWLIGVLSQERSSLGGIEQPLIGLMSDRTRSRLGKRRPFFLIGALLVGAANAVTTTLSFPLFTEMMPRERIGEFTGFSALVVSLSQAVGAALVGAYVDLMGDYRMAFVAAGLLIGVGFFLLQRVHPEKASDPAERLLTAIQ